MDLVPARHEFAQTLTLAFAHVKRVDFFALRNNEPELLVFVLKNLQKQEHQEQHIHAIDRLPSHKHDVLALLRDAGRLV